MLENLFKEAVVARTKAYDAYSNFKVGAALLTHDGKIFHGCNVENASYPLCNCAERTALFAAIAAGYKRHDFAALAVVADTEEPVSPCGACRQVMIELGGPDMPVRLGNMRGDVRDTTPLELLPAPFFL